MDEISESVLKKICSTCLSYGRELTQLCKIKDAMSSLYHLLSYDAETCGVKFNSPSKYYICYECMAMLKRLCSFRGQVCMAQRQLNEIIDGKIDIKTQKSLSKLSTTFNNLYDYEFIFDEATLDNFIACGEETSTKSDIDLNTSVDEKFLEIKPLEARKKRSVKNNKINKINDTDNEYYSVIQLSEEEMYEEIEKKRVEESFVNAEFKCESCVQIFKDLKEFEKHNIDLHEQKPRHIQCDLCKCYIQYWRIGAHAQSHRELYKCVLCEVVCSVVMMISHLKGHGIAMTALRELKRSAMALNPCLAINTIKRIKASSHACAECNKCFDNKYLRYRHIVKEHREGFTCHTCGKTFALKNTLNKHRQIHAPLPREQCRICMKLVRVDRVKLHALTHDARQSHHCVTCDARFVSRDSYQKHLNNSSAHARRDVHKYKCSICVKGFRTMSELNDHNNYKHVGSSQHKCPVCHKVLATRRGVTRHVRRTHLGLKEKTGDKILCHTCGKSFRDAKCLSEHELIHSGVRPLSCDTCGRSFRQRASLYTHKRRVHKIPARQTLLYTDIQST